VGAAMLLRLQFHVRINMNRTLKFLILLLLSGALLTGCNTARGFGEDIQGLGHAISHAVS